MKRITTLLIAAICAVVLFSCKKDTQTTTNTASGLLDSRLTSGDWAINYFYADSMDLTSQYTEYKFVFDANGHLAFANTLLTVNGTWAAAGASDAILSLNLNAAEGNEQSARVTGNWQVAAQSDDQVALKRTVDGDPGTEYMNLQKIKR